MVLLALATLWGASCAEGPPPVNPAGPAATPTDTRSGPFQAELFVRGEVLLLDEEGEESLGKVPAGTAPLGAPVETPSGILVEVGVSGDPLEIWLIRPDGDSELVAAGTQGFALDHTGSRFAYAQVHPQGQAAYGSATLVLSSLDDLDAKTSSDPIDGYARVVGFVGDQVVATTGDGAAVGISMWDPDTNTVRAVAGYTGALTTNTGGELAVLGSGDGPCWSVVRLDPDATATRTGLTGCDGLEAPTFSPDGSAFAAAAVEGDRRRVVAYAVDGSEPVYDRTMDGALQVAWASSSELLVLADHGSGSHALHSCPMSGDPCVLQWSGSTEATGYGEVWLVIGA